MFIGASVCWIHCKDGTKGLLESFFLEVVQDFFSNRKQEATDDGLGFASTSTKPLASKGFACGEHL